MDQIEMNVRVFLVNVTDDRIKLMEGMSSGLGVPRSFMEESPFALIGTTDQMIEDIIARREKWGFSYLIVGAEDVDSFAPVVAELAGK